VQRILKRIGSPFVRYFDHRFEEIKQQLREVEVTPTVDVSPVVGPVVGQLTPALAEITYNIAAAAETSAGVAATVDRKLGRFLDEQSIRARDSADALADFLATQHARELLNQGQLGRYRPEVVQFLNWVFSFNGPIAERSLLMNHPLTVLFDEEGPRLFEVNERIVEIPFVFNAFSGLPAGSRVVDVGSTESTVALSLASQGMRVTALDPRPYPFVHPNLTVVAEEVDRFSPPTPVSAVVAVSAVEHFGLGHYVGGHGASDAVDADRRALDRFREWLLPGGFLVLTVPTGRATTDDFQRVYDADRLKRLIDGWSVVRLELAARTTDVRWEPIESIEDDLRGVAMLVLE
jgi:hypothetical protein